MGKLAKWGFIVYSESIVAYTRQDLLENIFRLSPIQKRSLASLRIHTVSDLLFYFPFRYEEHIPIGQIATLKKGDKTAIEGIISGQNTKRSFARGAPRGEATLKDGTGSIRVLWFNQAYMAKKFEDGSLVRAQGTVGESKRGLYLANPEIEAVTSAHSPGRLFVEDDRVSGLVPVYPATRFLSSRWFSWRIREVLSNLPASEAIDSIPLETLKRYKLPSLFAALHYIHSPKTEREALAAKKRFAFEEVFYIQLGRQKDRLSLKKTRGYTILPAKEKGEDFLSRFPFRPTQSQEKAMAEIFHDLSSGTPMSRLLEGDVGSGKTLVAAASSFLTIETPPVENKSARLQVAYMAPTEILARQHFNSFISYFKHLNVPIALITGSECRKFPSKIDPDGHTHISRAQLQKWVAGGEIPIIIGTHALIQKSISFKHLALVIIDEQHRFGVSQRKLLAQKSADQKTGFLPHLLSMTATPIPRTLALTIYGDLDLSLIDELPHGRKKIKTEIVPPERRDMAYEKVRVELARGQQCFVICPRIDEPDRSKELALLATSAKTEAGRLAEFVFPKYGVGLVHGKMKTEEKENVMKEFAENKIQVLVATSVVEVGIDIPNATIMIIEGADRFGLAQLHQLRGRVGRSEHQSYCLLFTDTKSGPTLSRLWALEKAVNGFELAELDLALRGEGSLSGKKQWGLSDLGMEGIKNLKMVEAARKEARELLEKDSELTNLPLLKEKAEKSAADIHFE